MGHVDFVTEKTIKTFDGATRIEDSRRVMRRRLRSNEQLANGDCNVASESVKPTAATSTRLFSIRLFFSADVRNLREKTHHRNDRFAKKIFLFKIKSGKSVG